MNKTNKLNILSYSEKHSKQCNSLIEYHTHYKQLFIISVFYDKIELIFIPHI